MSTRIFYEDIIKIFNNALVRSYSEDTSCETVSFEVEADDDSVDFDKLARLSDLLHTRKINLSKSYKAQLGCETCGYGKSTLVPVTCSDVKFWWDDQEGS